MWKYVFSLYISTTDGQGQGKWLLYRKDEENLDVSIHTATMQQRRSGKDQVIEKTWEVNKYTMMLLGSGGGDLLSNSVKPRQITCMEIALILLCVCDHCEVAL